MTYRESTRLRVIKTRLSLLPESIRAQLLAANFGPHAIPPAIELRARLRAGLFILLGLLACGVSYLASSVADFKEDNAQLALITGIVAAAALGYGLVNAFRSMPLRMRFQAMLLAPHWLVCTDCIGSRVDLIPLAMVDRVVPSQAGRLEVILRDGHGTLDYPFVFELKHSGFFDAVRAAIPQAQIPGALPEALDRDVPPYSRVPSIVTAVAAVLLLGIPGSLFAIRTRANFQYTIVRDIAESDSNEDASLGEPQRSERRARSLEYATQRIRVFRESGGLTWWLMRRTTDVEARDAEFTRRLADARRLLDRARATADETSLSRTTDFRELRRIANEHRGTALGEQALQWIGTLLDQERINAAARGASQEQLALCQQLRYASTLTPPGGLQLRIETASDEDDTRAFTAMHTTAAERGYMAGLGYAAHSGFTDGLRTGLDEILASALEIHTGTYDPPSPSALVHATFEPIEPLLTYTRTERRGNRVVDSYSYPNIRITVDVTLRSRPDAAPIEIHESYTGHANAMAPEHMAEAYPTGERLYRALSETMGRQLAAAILERLCLR